MGLIYHEDVWSGMGTVIEAKIAVSSFDQGAKICKMVSEGIEELEHKMSYFLPDSFVSQLNFSNGALPLKIDLHTFSVLKAAQRYYKLSEGAFDITAAPLTSLWRACINNKVLPLENKIHSLLAFVSGEGITFDEKSLTVQLQNGQAIDLGGIGKGYAADMALEICKDNGINSAFINLGGNVKTLGKKINGEPWMIGLQDPRSKRGDFIAALSISDNSVVTSGDYEKYFEVSGKRYHHILDPKTGYPSKSDLMSATIVSKFSIDADALSTAVFVSGLDRGMELIKKSPGTEGVLITKEKKVFITNGLKESFTAQSNTQSYKFYFYN